MKLKNGIKKIILEIIAGAIIISPAGFNLLAYNNNPIVASAASSDYTTYIDRQGIIYHVYSDHAIVNDTTNDTTPKNITSANIPSTVRGVPVTSIGKWAFDFCSSLTSITISDSVTSIGEEAFAGCLNLTSITIPNSVTSIGDSAFYRCSSLTSITIPNSVTSIGDGAFESCSNLTEINVDANNKNYSSEDGILFNKDKTELLIYPSSNIRTSYSIPNYVTSIGNCAFLGCSSLTSVTIPNYVTSIEQSAFYGCSNLTSITIPNSVTSIGNGAFYGCSNLKDVYYGGSKEQWNKIPIAFYNECLASATIHYNSSEVTKNPAPTPTQIYGISIILQQSDPNSDGTIDAKDATMVLVDYANHIANNTNSLTSSLADANGDGAVDAKDATLILVYYANKISSGM